MHAKYPPRLTATLEVFLRWVFYSAILGWAAVLAACFVRFMRS